MSFVEENKEAIEGLDCDTKSGKDGPHKEFILFSIYIYVRSQFDLLFRLDFDFSISFKFFLIYFDMSHLLSSGGLGGAGGSCLGRPGQAPQKRAQHRLHQGGALEIQQF